MGERAGSVLLLMAAVTAGSYIMLSFSPPRASALDCPYGNVSRAKYLSNDAKVTFEWQRTANHAIHGMSMMHPSSGSQAAARRAGMWRRPSPRADRPLGQALAAVEAIAAAAASEFDRSVVTAITSPSCPRLCPDREGEISARACPARSRGVGDRFSGRVLAVALNR